jgi:UDP-2,3-diacylglucosamine pyrophosphatase LpxH
LESNLTNDNIETDSKVEKPVKKIKLVISDLHLGKGKFLPGGGINSLEEFKYGEKLVEFINYYSSGQFKDYEVEIIINGDFLNFLQVDYKGHFLKVITEEIAIEILKSIVNGHPNVFKAMRDFAINPRHSFTYIVGNHDQAMLWPGTRSYLDEIVGVPIRYKNIVYFFDGVHIEHGHMHEPANRLDPKRFFLKKDLPEPILNLPFGSHFFVDFVLKVKTKFPYVDKIRPFPKMIRWMLLNETKFGILTLWRLFMYFTREIFTKTSRQRWSIKTLIKVALENAVFGSLENSAKKILEDSRVHTTIFGHTHVYWYKQWSHDREYFNTGTWTEVTSLDIESLGKITKLTYVLLEYPEDGGRPHGRLKEWKGFYRIEEDVGIA